MAFGGVALKSLATFLRFIEFCCAAIVLALSLYYLIVLHNHGLPIATYIRAVTGISGAAVLYTIFALVLVCCVGGTFLSAFAILLDVAFAGAFVYIAWAYRDGTSSCKGEVTTPLGNGNEKSEVSNGKGGFTHLPSLYTACKMETAAFAVAIVGIIFFLLSMVVELGLMKHHKKEKAFGPSPNNGYTAGSPKRKFWQRKSRTPRDTEMLAPKVHPDALPAHTTLADATRSSYATDTTAVDQSAGYQKYGHGPHATTGHTQMPAAQDYQRTGANF